jgi:hypothetical protein
MGGICQWLHHALSKSVQSPVCSRSGYHSKRHLGSIAPVGLSSMVRFYVSKVNSRLSGYAVKQYRISVRVSAKPPRSLSSRIAHTTSSKRISMRWISSAIIPISRSPSNFLCDSSRFWEQIRSWAGESSSWISERLSKCVECFSSRRSV